MDLTRSWNELLKEPGENDHIVQVYQDREFLVDAVAEYVGTGVARGEAAVIIARPEHRAAFMEQLGAVQPGQITLLDAEETLGRFMVNGMPEWTSFHHVVGGLIAELRLQYPTVRAYGEMVDILWQRGEREAAIKLEEFWNDLGKLQTFSIFCAYYMDNLDAGAYGGPLECVCKVHSHLIPARDYSEFNQAVSNASREILDEPLAQILLSLSENNRPSTHMPIGQATLFWLKQNMPRTAEKVLSRIRSRRVPELAS